MNSIIKLGEIKNFFPYDQVMVSNPMIIIDDVNGNLYDGLSKELKKYKAGNYYYCSPDYFHLENVSEAISGAKQKINEIVNQSLLN